MSVSKKMEARGGTIRRVLQLIAPYRLLVVLSLALAAVTVVATLSAQVLTGRGVDMILGPGAVDFAGLGRLGMVRVAILCLGFALMLSAELMNTALERLCDRQSAGYDRLVKQVKDIAAAAVLVCAAFCAVIGMVFFVPSGALWCAVQTLAAYPWAAGILVLSVPAAVWFVFCFGRPQ